MQQAPAKSFLFFFHSAGTNSHKDVHDDEWKRTKKKRLPAWQWFPSLPPLLPNRLWEDPQKKLRRNKESHKGSNNRSTLHSCSSIPYGKKVLDCGLQALYGIDAPFFWCLASLLTCQVATGGSWRPSSSGCSCSCWGSPSWRCPRCRSSPKSRRRKRKVGDCSAMREKGNMNMKNISQNSAALAVNCADRVQPRCETLRRRPGHHSGSSVGWRPDQ